jgi:hypothetical protein
MTELQRKASALRPRCRATNRAGNPCGGFAVTPEGLCGGHAGFGFARSEAALAESRLAAARARKANAAKREQERTLAKQGVTARLRARTATDAEQIVTALFAPLDDPHLSSTARQAAALRILERVFGRPATAPDTGEDADVASLSLQDLLAAWQGEGESTPE